MDTKALRQKILDLAIRGKLVPQDPNDEPASVLLERIRVQKQQMVREGKLKAKDIKNDTVIFVGEDNLHYEKHADGTVKCIEDEIPFEVPEGWEWTRIGALTEYITSGSRGWAQYYSEEGALFLRMGNLSRDSFKLRMESIQRVQLPDKAEGIRTRVAANDLLFSITAEIGNLGLIPEGFEEAYINQHIGLIRFMSKAQGRYIPYVFLSDFCRSQYLFTVSGLKNSFRLDNIQSILIPIPPAAEQVRIVSKLDALWTLITIIEADKVGLSYIVSRTKEAILSLAIRGQLVPQNPDDEPASVLLDHIRVEKEALIKQGKIKRDKRESIIFRGDDNSYYERFRDGTIICVDNEILFELPDGWEWERLSNIAWFSGGKTPSMSHAEYWNGSIPWITSKDMKTKYLTTSMVKMTEEGATTQQLYTPGTVLVVVRSGILRHTLPVAILNTEATINQDIKAIELVDKCLSEYVYICLKALENYILLKYTKAGTTVENINFDEFARMLLPIPPADEMHRIIDRLFQTDMLIASISEYAM